MTVKAAVIIAVRRDDGTVEYFASAAVTEFRMRAPGWHLGQDLGEFNTFIVHGNNLEPWDPSMGMPEPPRAPALRMEYRGEAVSLPPPVRVPGEVEWLVVTGADGHARSCTATYHGITVGVHWEHLYDKWVWQPWGGSASRGFDTIEEAMGDAELWLQSRVPHPPLDTAPPHMVE